MPLNWIYQGKAFTESATYIFYDGQQIEPIPQPFNDVTVSVRNPIWYNTYATDITNLTGDIRSPGF
ncbi:hypothetical protein, partial [Salmonella enterica]|uniref:hypothetical protein n=1 Tax=Salmonella enterica TaxID=28901 RepID=UPI0020C54146